MPAASALRRSGAIGDPYLQANDFGRVLHVPGMGRFRVVHSYSRWNGQRAAGGPAPVLGRDTVPVLAAAGVDRHTIDDLIAREVLVAPPGEAP